MVGVGLALLGVAQAVKMNRVSKIKVSQVFIFSSLWKAGRLESWKIGKFTILPSLH
jgi:hypothetical protein